jgi:hypothetical protein
MTAHTSGPWFVARAGNDLSIAHDISESQGLEPDECHECVAKIYGTDDGNPEDTARLIAAAPDMLAVLQSMNHAPHNKRIGWYFKAIRAAIAKAEGTS